MLLTRLPLTPKGAFDLHVLSLPPAFVLSQDQTLKFKEFNLDCHIYAKIDGGSKTKPAFPPPGEPHHTQIWSMSLKTAPKDRPQGHRRLRFSLSSSLVKEHASNRGKTKSAGPANPVRNIRPGHPLVRREVRPAASAAQPAMNPI